MGNKTESKSMWVYEYEKAAEDRWKYKNINKEESSLKDVGDVRYVLGEIFDSTPTQNKKRVLICIGVNPSTAIPGILDPTLKRVQDYAEKNEYAEWYMLNLYPWRATNPDDLPEDEEYEKYEKYKDVGTKNIDVICKLLEKIPQADVWCAWGATIKKRSYLSEMCEEILDLFSGDGYTFMVAGQTKEGYPSHPLASQKESMNVRNLKLGMWKLEELEELCKNGKLKACEKSDKEKTSKK